MSHRLTAGASRVVKEMLFELASVWPSRAVGGMVRERGVEFDTSGGRASVRLDCRPVYFDFLFL